MTTERDGSITVREYDERSRLTAEVTPSGARVETAWDEHDRVVSVTVEGGDARSGRWSGQAKTECGLHAT